MGWRTVVIEKSSKLEFRMGYLVVRDAQETIRVHLSEISVLIIENTATSLTTALKQKRAEPNVLKKANFQHIASFFCLKYVKYSYAKEISHCTKNLIF